MKVLLFADFRSSHATGWAAGLEAAGIDVVPLSSHSHAGSLPSLATTTPRVQLRSRMARSLHRLPLGLDHRVLTAEAALRYRRRAGELKKAVRQERPDLVHALRVPYEGVTAISAVSSDVPVVVSTWGQDFLSQAAGDATLRFWMRRTLSRAVGIHADVEEDIDRALDFGLRPRVPRLVAAGNFGLREGQFAPGHKEHLVTFPRGVRGYVNGRLLLKMAERVLATWKDPPKFVAIGMGSQPLAGDLLRRHPDLFEAPNHLPRDAFADLLGRSRVIVSPSRSDGMPNSVLEALASGCVSVVGPLPQLRRLAARGSALLFVESDDLDGYEAALRQAFGHQVQATTAALTDRLPEAYRWRDNIVRVPAFYGEVLSFVG